MTIQNLKNKELKIEGKYCDALNGWGDEFFFFIFQFVHFIKTSKKNDLIKMMIECMSFKQESKV